MHKFAFINTLFGRITALRGTRNPHVHKSTLRFLRAVRLVLHPKFCIYISKLESVRFGYGNE